MIVAKEPPDASHDRVSTFYAISIPCSLVHAHAAMIEEDVSTQGTYQLQDGPRLCCKACVEVVAS